MSGLIKKKGSTKSTRVWDNRNGKYKIIYNRDRTKFAKPQYHVSNKKKLSMKSKKGNS